MINLTLFSLNTFALLSLSPLHMQIELFSSASISILKSHFSYSFTNIFLSIANNRNVIQNSIFTHSLGSAICFSKIDDIQEEIIINHKVFYQTLVYNDTSHFGYLLLGNCIISYCHAYYGAGLYISQDLMVKIHGCIFKDCIAFNGAGGYICYSRSDDNDLNLNSKLRDTTVQYCCFYQCAADDVGKGYGYGSALIISSKQVTLFLSSALDCANPDRVSRGAHFEILSDNISSSNLNMTNGLSLYGGFIEYRKTDFGFFKLSTLYNSSCMYVTAFTTSNEVEMQYCNFIQNKIKDSDGFGDLPAMIFIIQSPFTISNCIFLLNEFGSGARIAIMNTVTGVIPLINCYADSYSVNENDIIETVNCNFNCNDQLASLDISFLNLEPCKGIMTVDPIPITKVFTPSSLFSLSKYFTSSSKFSFTSKFSESYIFTFSKLFTRSNFFTQTKFFSQTKSFTNSQLFTISNGFTHSNHFSKTKIFTSSDDFSNSKKFLNSNEFTFSGLFSNSNKFTFSYMFSNSDFFIISFSKTFSNSNYFSMTNSFTDSKYFSQSDLFTDSHPFTPTPSQSYESHIESITMILSQSFVLIKSVTFTITNFPSIYFTKCGDDVFERVEYIQTAFPYIIQFMLPTFISVKMVLDLVMEKKKISPEQLIGSVCGSVTIFFIIIAIIIIALKNKNKLIALNNSIDISDISYSSDIDNQQVFENNTFDNKNTQNEIDDSWI